MEFLLRNVPNIHVFPSVHIVKIHFLLENLLISEPSSCILEKFWFRSDHLHIKYNCTQLFLDQCFPHQCALCNIFSYLPLLWNLVRNFWKFHQGVIGWTEYILCFIYLVGRIFCNHTDSLYILFDTPVYKQADCMCWTESKDSWNLDDGCLYKCFLHRVVVKTWPENSFIPVIVIITAHFWIRDLLEKFATVKFNGKACKNGFFP